LKYLIIGAGGTGGSIGAFMTEAGKDVSLIARGPHLAAIQDRGLRMETVARGSYTVAPVKACEMDQYQDRPDVIFDCVKGYSQDAVIPFIRRVAHRDTVVIPVLNIYGTGGRMQAQLPGLLVTDGCIYIAAEISEPGTILLKGEIFRIIYGVRSPDRHRPVLDQVARDLKDSGITGIVSEDIRRDALQKFAYVSPMAACGAYWDADAGAVQAGGEPRETFVALTREIVALAQAMGIHFTVDVEAANLRIIAHLAATTTTSMHRDLKQGRPSEIDGLIFEVVRLARQYGVPVPVYERIASRFGFSA
jgi:2-dehydropantoate 2-reductase